MAAGTTSSQAMARHENSISGSARNDRGTPEPTLPNPAIPTSLAIVAVMAAVFVTEFVVMLVLAQFEQVVLSPWVMVVDASIVSVVAGPVVFLLVRSLVRYEHDSRLVAERRAASLGRLAMTDWLTQVLNRHGIESALLEAMALSERYRHVLSVALVDIDHFKAINDAYGHDAGDRVLARLADVLSRGVRTPDKVGRYGGEEFLLAFPETDLSAALTLVERVRSTVGDTKFDVGTQEVPLTISVGVTQFRPGEDLRTLTRRVDQAMYEAKRGGRDLVVSR